MRPRSGLTLACLTALLATTTTLAARAADSDPPAGGARGLRPEAVETLRPWRPSFDFETWVGAQIAVLPAPHGLYSEEELEEVRRQALVDPDLPAGRDASQPATMREVDPRFGEVEVVYIPRQPKRKKVFEGLNQTSAAFSPGSLPAPPDTNVAAGPERVVEVVNVGMRLTDRSGNGEVLHHLTPFFADPDIQFFDPRVYYDHLSGRFFIVSVGRSFSPRRSYIYLAVSRSASPGSFDAPGDWCTYRQKAKRGATWADYPTLGANERWLAVSVNNFKFGNGKFKAAYLYTWEIGEAVDNAAGCPALTQRRFKLKRDALGFKAFVVHPGQHYTASAQPGAPLFLVSAELLLGGSRDYTLWRLQDDGSGPRLTKSLVTGSFSYSFAPLVPQSGGLDMDGGDPRVTQVAVRDDKVWAVHGTACSIAALPNEACVRVLEITPGGGGGGAVTFEETFGRADLFYFWPGIALNGRGDAVTAFQATSADGFLGTAHSGKDAGQLHFSVPKLLKDGSCPLADFDSGLGAVRTGDYVGVHADPVNQRDVWIGGEYASGAGVGCQWGTRIARVRE